MHRKVTNIDPYAAALIRHKVRRLLGHQGLSFHDGEDLEQELALHVHIVQPKYDPTRGAATTFYDRVLTRKLTCLVRSQTAQKRDRRHDVPLEFEPPSPGCHAALDIKLDLRDCIGSFPAPLRHLARCFMDGEGELQAARSLRWTRGAVRHRRSLIAHHLNDAGLAPQHRGGKR